MTKAPDNLEAPSLTPNALLLGNMALAAGLIREAATKAAAATDADTIVNLLGQIGEYSDTIRDAASDMAEALGCGADTVEAVREGLARIEAFRACQGLEGRA